MLTNSNKTLHAFYDLSTSAPSYDFFSFLVLAELERVSGTFESLAIIVIPENLLRDSSGHQSDQKWLINQIILPACSFIESCRGNLTVCISRDQAKLFYKKSGDLKFPRHYSLDMPSSSVSIADVQNAYEINGQLPPLKSAIQADHYIDQWIETEVKGRKIITFTLDSDLSSIEINEWLKLWGGFVESLETDVYMPVLVRDNYENPSVPELGISGISDFPAVALNLELRMALYEKSDVNILNGASSIFVCMYNPNISFLAFLDNFGDTLFSGIQFLSASQKFLNNVESPSELKDIFDSHLLEINRA